MVMLHEIIPVYNTCSHCVIGILQIKWKFVMNVQHLNQELL